MVSQPRDGHARAPRRRRLRGRGSTRTSGRWRDGADLVYVAEQPSAHCNATSAIRKGTSRGPAPRRPAHRRPQRPVRPRPARPGADPPGARAAWPTCTGRSSPGGPSCWPPGRSGPASSTPVALSTSPPRPRTIRDDPDWRVAEPAPGLEDRRVEITGPTDKKMAINALNSGAKVWLADFEDANSPLFENMLAGQANLRGLHRREVPVVHPGRRQGVRAQRGPARRPGDPPARLAPPREAPAGRRRAGLRRHLRLRAVPAALRPGADRRRPRPVLLPAQDGEPPRGTAVERRLRPCPGSRRHPTRHGPGDGADRDLPGRVLHGGDPLRAARALGRAQRRALGLPVQRDQEVPHPRAPTTCSPTATRSR